MKINSVLAKPRTRCKKTLYSFPVGPLQEHWKAAVRSPRSLLFSRLNRHNSLRLSSYERCSIPLINFAALLWTRSNRPVHVFPVLRAPELDTVLEEGSHQRRAEGQNLLPRPAGQDSFDSAQDTAGLLGCEHTLLGHMELLINQHPQALPLRAALNPFSVQPVLHLGIAQPMCRTWHLALLNFTRFSEAHLSSRSRSLCMASLPSSMSTAPHCLVSLQGC